MITGRPELIVSAQRSIVTTAVMLTAAAAGLFAALLTHDFSLEYVAAHSSLNTPTMYLLSAFWAGSEGALLSLAVAFALAASVMLGRSDSIATVHPVVASAMLGTLTLMSAALCLAANPYDRVAWVPNEGRGLAPLLQQPLAALRPLFLHAGLAAASVIAVAAVGSALAGRGAALRGGAAGRLASVAWTLLSIGLVIDMRLTYLDPAATGLWTWDAARTAQSGAWLFALVATRRAVQRHASGSPRPRLMYVAYGGLALVVIGMMGGHWAIDRTLRLRPGEGGSMTDSFGRPWMVVSQGVSRDEQMNYLSTAVALEISRGGRAGRFISPERRQYLDGSLEATSPPVVVPGVYATFAGDLYAVLTEVSEEDAELRLGFRPLASAVWLGGALVAAAALLITVGRPAVASPPTERDGVI